MKSRAIQKSTNKENTDDDCIDLTNGSSPTPPAPTPLMPSVLPVSTSQKSVLRKWHVLSILII